MLLVHFVKFLLDDFYVIRRVKSYAIIKIIYSVQCILVCIILCNLLITRLTRILFSTTLYCGVIVIIYKLLLFVLICYLYFNNQGERGIYIIYSTANNCDDFLYPTGTFYNNLNRYTFSVLNSERNKECIGVEYEFLNKKLSGK